MFIKYNNKINLKYDVPPTQTKKTPKMCPLRLNWIHDFIVLFSWLMLGGNEIIYLVKRVDQIVLNYAGKQLDIDTGPSSI